eukprot:TRINITY_DN7817_c0_g1_i2.p1 TRINITY_DN7817_c0_g1~~TRINITY_DN7817_c0_g1_i2.p1  ORF type:complete len:198 (-),score=33.15 TRINITY_DN7817_c0_g1_i2:150-743(-)
MISSDDVVRIRPSGEMVNPPTMCPSYDIEFSVHRPGPLLLRDILGAIPSLRTKTPNAASELTNVLVVPTFQPSNADLIDYGRGSEEEKDRLLENFVSWGNEVVRKLTGRQLWGDIVDPCSGQVIHSTPGPSTYNEVDACQQLLKYTTHRVGNMFPCAVISHPRWATSSYPATLFTTAPLATLLEVIREIDEEHTHQS